MQCNAKKLGLAGGILWGLALFLTTLLGVWTNYAHNFLNILIGIYPKYRITYAGSILGLIYGFIDGYVGLYLLAWIYNKLLRKG